MKKILMLSALCCVTAACKTEICTQEMRAGLTVQVFDHNTGEALHCGVNVVFKDDAYSETFTNPEGAECDEDMKFEGAWERSGTYTVEVSKQGYAPLTQEDVIVEQDECHVSTETIIAFLRPSAS